MEKIDSDIKHKKITFFFEVKVTSQNIGLIKRIYPAKELVILNNNIEITYQIEATNDSYLSDFARIMSTIFNISELIGKPRIQIT